MLNEVQECNYYSAATGENSNGEISLDVSHWKQSSFYDRKFVAAAECPVASPPPVHVFIVSF